MPQDNDFMAIALDLARLGLGRTSPNPVVGAVIVKNGKIIGQGFHKKAGMPHAEVEAINSLTAHSSQLKTATLYVTLEPCCHYGRTPPCTEAILKSGIQKVVIGMQDPDPKVSRRGIKILKKAGLEVRTGVLRKECEQLNEAYIKHRKTGKPWVHLKMAISLDGMIGSRGGTSSYISRTESRAFVHEMRDRVDAILVGVETILQDDPQLNTRLPSGRGKDPIRIILDSSLRIPSSAKVLHLKSSAPTWVATTVNQIPSHLPHVECLFCRKSRDGKVDLSDLLNQLGKRGILTLLVEGGAKVAASFLREGWVDKISLFLSPRFLGKRGVALAPHLDLRTLDIERLECREIGEDILLEGIPKRKG